MLAAADSIIHEQEALQGQIEFLKGDAIRWKVSPLYKENNRNNLSQLILTIYYLKEGLENLYRQEDNFLFSNVELQTADEIKFKHKAVLNSLDEIYRSLVNLSSEMLQLKKENLSETIDSFCQTLSLLNFQENAILKSQIN
jgi:hypothetical protein